MSSLEIQPDYYHALRFFGLRGAATAQDAKAKAWLGKAAATPVRGDRPPSAGNFTALAAMPARYALERGDWKAQRCCPSRRRDTRRPIR
jgi:hypothetical protein